MVHIIAGRYVLLGEQARLGGQSTIRKASDTTDGTVVAVKLLSGSTDDILHKVFERETSTLRSLDHPNIIRLRDSGIDQDGTPYLVFEWVEESLATTLETGRPYTWDELAELLAPPILSGLSHAHLKNIEHRDIKPGNVLIRGDGAPVLADFGIAKLRTDLGSSDLTVANFRSVPYAPPEHDTSVPFVRDVFSVGVLLLQALSGDRLREYTDVSQALDTVHIPPHARELIRRCVDFDRHSRPANGAVLLSEFNRVKSLSASQQSSRPVIHVHLTKRVSDQLQEAFSLDSVDHVRGAFLSDISDDAHAEFRLDRTTHKVDVSTIQVTGDACGYLMKRDNGTPNLTVVSARTYEYDALEAMRRRALSTNGLVAWSCDTPRNKASAQVALDFLARALEDHEEARNFARQQGQGTGLADDLFDSWLRLLQAQEEVARGDLQQLRYSKAKRDGREANFSLANKIETDLVGNEMQVVIEESGKVILKGEIIDQTDNEVRLRAARLIPSLPQHGLLTPFLGPTQTALQRKVDAVTAIRDGTAARPDLSDLILNPALAAPPVSLQLDDWNAKLDPSKKAAVQAAIGAKDLVLVEGPPGTGKTTFITEVVARILDRNPTARILIVSQTHVAVDNAIERLDNAGIKSIVRLGAPDDARIDRRIRHLLLDQQMPKWAALLRKRAESYLRDRAASAEISNDHLHASLELREVISLTAEIESIELELSSLSDRNDAKSASVGALRLVALREKIEQLSRSRLQHFGAAQKHLAGDLTLTPNMNTTDISTAIDLLLGNTGIGQDMLRILSLQSEWLKRVASDANLAASFLQTSNVIAGTCIGFLRHPAVRDLEIDVCILDEASKATATEALVPMARAKRWILIGDTNQLPPMDEEVLRRPDLLEEYDLDVDFAQETLFSYFAKELPEHSRFLLNEQYRMIRPIGDLISTCFYKGKLYSPRTAGIPGFETLGKSVMWLDTKRLGAGRRETSEASGTSYANRSEAKIAAARLEVIDRAIEKGLVGDQSAGPLKVLIVAPYRRQVEELKLRLSSLRLENLSVEVQTVDAVQGREADLTIFSVTRSNPSGRLGFLGQDYWRRINVALSRARFGLTIIGDAEFCAAAPGALQQVYRYMKENTSDCEIREADDV